MLTTVSCHDFHDTGGTCCPIVKGIFHILSAMAIVLENRNLEYLMTRRYSNIAREFEELYVKSSHILQKSIKSLFLTLVHVYDSSHFEVVSNNGNVPKPLTFSLRELSRRINPAASYTAIF
jgi:hypothetical protein